VPTPVGIFLIAKWNYLVCLFVPNFWDNCAFHSQRWTPDIL